jgi:SAM-dependent methyltransferase
MPEPSAEQILDVNVRYHDLASHSYDSKWGIDYGEKGAQQVLSKMQKALGQPLRPMGRGLEIGAGTGYFSLNLLKQGLLSDVTCTDVSARMLETLAASAEKMHLDAETVVCDAENLPFDSGSFDIVFGHAVLHHIPDLDAAFREVLRVLKPGGRFVFAGEPTRIGDRYARLLGGLTWKATTAVTRLPALRGWRRPQTELDESSRAAALEAVVDVHTFDPAELEALARGAGAADVRVVTEELSAAVLGWPVRTFEAAVPADKLGFGWAMFAYRSWLRLSWLDEHVLARVLPRAWFYNALVTGTRPA